ncbi:MAG: sulfotransferase family 2 domain-containing protein [Pirellulaceae bacterium]|nr:sulfotransferase family 2 domain-containing protein [Pirellulaceae bacterium]
MKTYNPEEPIIYTHIPKCAGTSVVRLLKEWFGPAYHKLNQDETQDILLPKVEALDANGNWLPNVKCIHGHFNHGRGYGLPYYYPEITQYFTILRDPFDLIVSMYFFAKGRSKEGKFWFRGEQVDFSKQFPSVSEYVRGYPYWLYHHLPQNVSLINYQQVLSERFVYMGIFEDMEQTLRNLAKILGKPERDLPHMNVSNYDEKVPESLRDQFYSDYPLLKKVYDFAAENHRAVSEKIC